MKYHAVLSLVIANFLALSPHAIAQSQSREEKADLKMQGTILLTKWTECVMHQAATVGLTTRLEPVDGVRVAQKACMAEREAWVDSQVAIGWPRSASEDVADGSERCEFSLVESQIELTRRHATVAERQMWVLAHKDDQCDPAN